MVDPPTRPVGQTNRTVCLAHRLLPFDSVLNGWRVSGSPAIRIAGDGCTIEVVDFSPNIVHLVKSRRLPPVLRSSHADFSSAMETFLMAACKAARSPAVGLMLLSSGVSCSDL